MKTHIELNYRSGVPFLQNIDDILAIMPERLDHENGSLIYLKSQPIDEYIRVTNSFNEIKEKLWNKE